MERRDRAADAVHPEIHEDAYRTRASGFITWSTVMSSGRERGLFHAASLSAPAARFFVLGANTRTITVIGFGKLALRKELAALRQRRITRISHRMTSNQGECHDHPQDRIAGRRRRRPAGRPRPRLRPTISSCRARHVDLVAPPFVHPHEQATKEGPKIIEFKLTDQGEGSRHRRRRHQVPGDDLQRLDAGTDDGGA